MNNIKAEGTARSFLSEKIELIHTEPSEGLALHNFDASEEALFEFRLFGHPSIGSSEYVAVSRKTGRVRYIGHLGE